MTPEPIMTRVSVVEDIAENIRSYTLSAVNDESLPSFSAGAHIDVMLDNGMIRQYSLCNVPEEKENYQIAVLNDPNGRGGSAYIHQTLKQGDLLPINNPRNHFRLDEQCDNYLLIAGGIGITPIMLMAMRLQELGKPFTMYYLCRTPEQAAFKEILECRLGDNIRFHYSHGDASRRLDIQQLLNNQTVNTQLYTCGSEPLLETILRTAEANPLINASYERFSAAPVADVSENTSFEVELAGCGSVLTVQPDQSILEVLRNNGHTIETMCEEGLCGSCEVGLLEGEADHRDSVLTDEEKAEQDIIMVCCSRGRSSRLKLDL